MRPWIAVAWCTSSSSNSSILIYPNQDKGHFSDRVPLGISGRIQLHVSVSSRHNILMRHSPAQGSRVFWEGIILAMHGSLVTSSLIAWDNQPKAKAKKTTTTNSGRRRNLPTSAAHRCARTINLNMRRPNNNRSFNFFPSSVASGCLVYIIGHPL